MGDDREEVVVDVNGKDTYGDAYHVEEPHVVDDVVPDHHV